MHSRVRPGRPRRTLLLLGLGGVLLAAGVAGMSIVAAVVTPESTVIPPTTGTATPSSQSLPATLLEVDGVHAGGRPAESSASSPGATLISVEGTEAGGVPATPSQQTLSGTVISADGSAFDGEAPSTSTVTPSDVVRLPSSASSTVWVNAVRPPATSPLSPASLGRIPVESEREPWENAVRGPETVIIGDAPDLVVDSVSDPPASGSPGDSFSVTDTTRNQGAASAGPSTTRYYLSTGTTRDGGDVPLTGSRSVPGLSTAESSTGSVTVTIPAATPGGTYYLLACADDAGAVLESNETNNCRASLGTITIEVCGPGDTDGDGFSDEVECYIGTDPKVACGVDCWPPDFNNDQEVDIFDLLMLAEPFNCDEGEDCYDRRYDLNADRSVDIFDVLIWADYFKQTCTV